jgi:hypothetical protein
MGVVLSCFYQMPRRTIHNENCTKLFLTNQRRNMHIESGLKLLIPKGRGETHTMRVELSCLY